MPDEVTLVRDAIHNPADARHFMRIARPACRVTAHARGVLVAASERARKVKEVGLDVYDPVLYFPREDVEMDALVRTEKSSHCPLKGDTEYFDLVVDGERIADAAWSYVRPLDFADALRDLVAFDARLVQIVEHAAERRG